MHEVHTFCESVSDKPLLCLLFLCIIDSLLVDWDSCVWRSVIT